MKGRGMGEWRGNNGGRCGKNGNEKNAQIYDSEMKEIRLKPPVLGTLLRIRGKSEACMEFCASQQNSMLAHD